MTHKKAVFVSLLFTNANGWCEVAFIVYFIANAFESTLQDYLEAFVRLRYNNAKECTILTSRIPVVLDS